MKHIFALFFLLTFLQLSSQYELDWVNIPQVGNGLFFYPDDAATDDDGNFYVLTTDQTALQATLDVTTRAHVVKFTPDGAEAWRVYIGISSISQVNYEQLLVYRNNHLYLPFIDVDTLKIIKVDCLGNFEVIHSKLFNENLTTSNYQLFINKSFNNHLYVAFQRQNSSSTNCLIELDENDQFVKEISMPNALIWSSNKYSWSDGAGNTYCHYLKLNALEQRFIKYDTLGGIVWDTLFVSANYNYSIINVDSNGNYYTFDSIHVKKYNTNRDLLWTYNTQGTTPVFIDFFTNGDLYAMLRGPLYYQSRLVKIDSMGTEVFSTVLPNFLSTISIYSKVTQSKNIVISTFLTNDPMSTNVSRFQVMKTMLYDSNGVLKSISNDTVFMPILNSGSGYDHSHIRIDKNENINVTYKFQPPSSRYADLLDSSIYNSKFEMWYVARFCKNCRFNIKGNVAIDSNANCMNDTLDVPLPGSMVKLEPQGKYTLTNPKGDFRFSSPANGNYTLKFVPNEFYLASCDTQQSFVISNSSPTATYNFVAQPNPICNGFIRLMASRARPGFIQTLKLDFSNVSSTVWDGYVSVKLDSGFNFIAATPSSDSVSGNTRFWRYANLKLFEEKSITLSATVPFPINRVYSHTAFLTNSCTSGISFIGDTLVDVISGSYDPNDKIIFPLVVREQNGFNTPDQELVYQINFQNTGTDTAFRVVVRDTLSSNLDVETFRMIGASHQYLVNINEGRSLEWTFNNILLPDSNTNERRSHGFIKFSIKPKKDIMLGEVIENKAAIYFDFNDPIITNNVVLEHKLFTGLETLEPIINNISIFPNPSNGLVKFRFSLSEASILNIHQLDGKLIDQHTIASTATEFDWDMSKYQSGIYSISLVSGQNIITKKLVKF